MGKNLVDFLVKNSKSKFTSSIEKSKYFNKEDEFTVTEIPLLNVGLSGEINGGLSSGVTMIAGEPKRFKTLYGLIMVKAFLDKHKDGVCLYYDTEGGAGKRYFESLGLDITRIVWTPCLNVEELKHEVSNQLEALKNADETNNKVIIFVDSIGNPPSKKEIADAIEGSDKADMTRAKQIKSFFRIVTLPCKLLDIPMIVINHTYKSQSFIPEDIVSGGMGSQYAADNIWVILKRQIKEGTEVEGFTFEIKVDRSRFVKEKSKLPINVYYGEGIAKYSGLSELAQEFKIVETCKVGRSKGIKFGEMEIPEKYNDKNEEFWMYVLNNSDLAKKIKDKYSLSSKVTTIDEDLE